MLQSLKNINSQTKDSIKWDSLLDSNPKAIYRLLYSLQIVDSLMESENDHEVRFSNEKNSEKILEKKMKVVRTDNAKEFLGKDFKGLLNDEGVETQQCTPHEHSQNPYAERAIGVITDIANTLITQSNAPPKLWGEAVMAAAAIHELT